MNIVATKLGQSGMEVINNMLLQFFLKSLLPRFDHFKLTYSIQERKWSLEDLTSLCARGELRLNEVNYESLNFASTSKMKKMKHDKHKQKDKKSTYDLSLLSPHLWHRINYTYHKRHIN